MVSQGWILASQRMEGLEFCTCIPRTHRCRAKQRPPGRGANDRSVTPPANGGGVRLSPIEKVRPRRIRAVARAVVMRGAFRVGGAFLSGSFLATSCRPSPPLHFAVLEPGVGCSRCRQSRQTQPQTSPLRSSFLLTPFRGALVRCGVGVACGATSAPSAIVFEGCHTHASAFSGFLGGCRRCGSSI